MHLLRIVCEIFPPEVIQVQTKTSLELSGSFSTERIFSMIIKANETLTFV